MREREICNALIYIFIYDNIRFIIMNIYEIIESGLYTKGHCKIDFNVYDIVAMLCCYLLCTYIY